MQRKTDRMRRLTITFSIILLTACTGERPQDIGVKGGKLARCPESDNCVSSYENDKIHGIAPIQGSLAQIRDAINATERATVITDESDYISVEFTSRIMRFVDDVEFYTPEDNGMIHVRSASRLGTKDMGVNRDRIEAIRSAIK